MAKTRICGIYKIQNIINGKIYIGQSVNIHKRWRDHKYYLNHNIHQNLYLQRAWNKYGKDSFIFEILILCNEDKLNINETHYINLFKSNDFLYGFNTDSGGNNMVCNDIKRTNMKLASKINKPILQINLNGNIVREWYGIREIEKHLKINTRNIRDCCNHGIGRKTAFNYIWIYKKDYNPDTFNLNYYITKNKNNKPIIQYDLQGNFIAKYNSAREVELLTGISYKNISRYCNNNRKHPHFIFEFEK